MPYSHIWIVQLNRKINKETQTDSGGLENIFHANGDQKKARVAILISDKIDFKIKTVGNICIPVVDSFRYLAKLIQFCKV